MNETIKETREKCYKCYRPKSSCVCKHITKIDTNTKFIILMHLKEFRKTRNNTGFMTNCSLNNSEVIMGIDFTSNSRINEIIEEYNCFILYPDANAIKINKTALPKNKHKKNAVFIIDSTWPCSKKILKLSKNLQNLPKISFETNVTSAYKIKTQPSSYCLSTIESTKVLLELLNLQKNESIKEKELDTFLNPFLEMVKYQVDISLKAGNDSVRYKIPYKKRES